jgi:hypothetical protein
LPAAIPFMQIRTRMALKVPRQKGKYATTIGGPVSSPLPKGSWERSWVMESNIELFHQGRVLLSANLVGCRPTGGNLVPAPQPGEAVVLYEHFRRGFALPASNFLR